MNQRPSGPPTLASLKQQVQRPTKVVVTGGMPYANAPLHVGHLAGALVPPDICARYWRMLVGPENVLFVTGNDDHGSTSELAALKAHKPIREFIDEIHEQQSRTLQRYAVEPSIFSGTSQPDCYPIHSETSQDFIRKLHKNGMLEKKISKQWFDPKLQRFLQDRFVMGTCPKCGSTSAYSDQCEACGAQFDPSELKDPRSTISDATPELRDTVHWWLDLWKVSEPLREWVQGKTKTWRASVYNEALGTVMPALAFSNTFEAKYKELKTSLPQHKSKYAAGKKVQLQFENKAALQQAKKQLDAEGIDSAFVDGWAHRSISRDVSWGIPMPADLDPDMRGKTFYVWPDSLIAPISFCKVVLKKQGRDPEAYKEFWTDPKARVLQFLGQDNVYFYTLMQGALWLGTQDDSQRQPLPGEFQLSDIFGSYHLWLNGEKMSKSTGNFYTGDQLLDEYGYAPEQVRYFLATLSLSEKNSNLDFGTMDEKCKFLAGPMNAAFEKPISACHSQFGGKVPEGKLIGKVEEETTKLVQKYLRSMERADFPVLLGQMENYARLVNSLFTQHKPHDDRHPEGERRDALFSCFYVLKNLMIMLYPFAPTVMERLRGSLRLPESVFRINELGTPIEAGHTIGEKQVFFPPAADRT
jgi:methionyl-tRNA synthetase